MSNKVMSNITKENAAKIFRETKKFFTKGETKILASNVERNFDAKEAANILSKAEKEIAIKTAMREAAAKTH